MDVNGADRADVIARGDRNLCSYLRHLARNAPDGSYADVDGVLMFAGGHPYPGTYTNGVIRASNDDQPEVPPRDVLAAASEFFRPLRRGFAVWIRGHADDDLEKACQAEGMFQRPPIEGNPAIASPGRVLGVPDLVGVEIRTVDSAETRAAYLRVVLTGYGVEGLPPELAERVIFSTASIDDPRVVAYLAYVDGDPAAGCMAFVEDGTAGMQWAATLPAARGHGLGKAVFRATNDAAVALGATLLTGQASQMGLPLWRSLGFDVVTYYRRYLAKPPR
jgi:GNAT superfamily N-acetyltransferase